ncbi:hypothetical protein N6H14_15285 [Paenibacillus sp. CC-CFT747]|nr:hypothetical protein N6H14_15285 [Paenibacillus sp. CC-CFT747]
MIKKLPKVIGKSKATKQKVTNVFLRRPDARIKVDLGDGFERLEFTRSVPGRNFYRFTFLAGSRKTISAGWSWPFTEVFPVLSYPQGNDWVILLHNTNPSALDYTFYFISKA